MSAPDTRPLDLRTLAVGKTTTADITDATGAIVVPRGTTIDVALLRALRIAAADRLHVGPDWSSAEPGDDGHDQLEASAANQRAGGPGVTLHLRARPRSVWRSPLVVTVELPGDGEAGRRELIVVTEDVSTTGFAFFAEQYVHVGSYVWARLQMLPSQPTVKGIVRNCVLLSGRRHRVGVEFTEIDACDAETDHDKSSTGNPN